MVPAVAKLDFEVQPARTNVLQFITLGKMVENAELD